MTEFNFEDFSIDDEPEFTANLETIQADANEAVEIQAAMDALELELAELKGRYRHLTEKRIPAAMQELGLNKFELESGAKISIKDSITGTINRAPDFEFARQYIIDNGAADLLKTEVKTEFGRGSHNEALALAADLRERGLDVKATETIHPQTYASFGRELYKEYTDKLEKGLAAEEIPFEALGLFYVKKADIKVAKGKK